MRRRILFALGVLIALLAVAYTGAAWYMAGQAVAVERVPIETTPASVGLLYEDVTFSPRGADLTLRGWYIAADGAAKGTIVLLHGVDSNRAGRLELVRDLHDAGFRLLLFDLRAHGESEGELLSAGYFETQDVFGALDYVTGAKGERWERAGVLGFSLGAAIALMAAEQEPRLRAVVADSAFADLSDLIVAETAKRTPLSPPAARLLMPGMIGLARLRYGIPLDKVRPVQSIAALGYPVLLVHGEADARITPAHSQRLKAAARDAATELWLVPGTEHADASKTQPEEYVRRVGGYFSARFATPSAAQFPPYGSATPWGSWAATMDS
ncbi:MAG: alpha/beta fold hydrolase [Chloroflexi bacterium]|nr:alpha/beta fold hydrolase [Chloroflexota bacterium]